MDSLSEKEVQNRLYVHCVLFTLIIYEHLATVSQAARYVWPWRWKFGTILFLINRYALLSLGAVLLAMAGATRTSSCNIIERLYFLLTIILNLTVILFTAVRASLLWDRSVLVFLVVFGIFSVGTAIYIMNLASVSETYMHSAVRDGVWCYARFDLSPSAQRIPLFLASLGMRISDTHEPSANQVAHICAIVGDTVAIVMTWMKMFKNFQQLQCFIRYGEDTSSR
ncbi:hypothetical protein BC835DRAFT_1308166 [Cytidiella melzeri]|nr:hypothetical protein BC835DRAFT_1308166 [Cytidiella melzeri]